MFGRSYSAACMAQSVCHIHFGEKRKVIRKSTYIAALEPYQPNEREESSDVIQVLEVGYSITDFVIATEQILYIYFSI